MVVPHDDLRHFGVESPHVVVEQVVLVVPAEVVDRLGRVRLGRRHDVLPHRPVVQRHFGGERLVGVDGVAGVDEHVRLRGAHRLVEAKTAPLGIDAPALADGVGRPGDGDIARSVAGRLEAARGRQAPPADVSEILEEHAVEDPLARRQVRQGHAGSEIGCIERGRPLDAQGMGESIGGVVLDEHAGRAIGAAPDDGTPAGHIARGDALRNRGTRRFLDDERRRPAETGGPDGRHQA